jgi:hypothetical protein
MVSLAGISGKAAGMAAFMIVSRFLLVIRVSVEFYANRGQRPRSLSHDEAQM